MYFSVYIFVRNEQNKDVKSVNTAYLSKSMCWYQAIPTETSVE